MDTAITSDQPLVQKLDTYLTRAAPFGFSGALLVAKEGQMLLNQGYGFADRTAETPNTSETVFSLGSVTKQFTAAAIMKLEMMGKLNTEAPISRYLDVVSKDKAGITLHHLLTHTAGLINYTGDDFVMASRDEALEVMLNAPLLFVPGERYEYSNAGYSLLAAIVELVSEQAYESLVREQLFEPAGMMFTGYRLPDWEGGTVAHWYVDEQDNGTPLEKPYPSWNLLGNGDMLSTTTDMYRWHQALQSEAVLSHEAKEKLYRPFLDDYAYGWSVKQTPHGTLVEHSGGSTYGTSAHFARYLDEDVVFILFCNEMNGGAFPMPTVREAVRELLFGGEPKLPPVIQLAGVEAAQIVEGEHELVEGGRIRIRRVHQRLHVTPLDEAAHAALFNVTVSQQQELKALTAKVLSAAMEGDYLPLENILANKEKRLNRVKQSLEGFLQGLTKESLEVVSPVPSRFIPGALDVFITFRGTESKEPLLFIWRDGQNIGYTKLWGDAHARQRLMIPCLPQNDGQLLGYHFGTAQAVRVHLRQ